MSNAVPRRPLSLAMSLNAPNTHEPYSPLRRWPSESRRASSGGARWKWIFFFFQAEAGIRVGRVTGVQTCALPISFMVEAAWRGPNVMTAIDRAAEINEAFRELAAEELECIAGAGPLASGAMAALRASYQQARSEERRGGKYYRAIPLVVVGTAPRY